MAEHRELRDDEMPRAVELWTQVFGVESPFFQSLLEGGEAEDNVSLAALEGGEIVSSVHVFMRRIRDREGRPIKVGGIGSVSTHPNHRKRGHSGRLLELALAAMEREGCVWSFLGTGVNDHYARYGWRTVSTPDPWGDFHAQEPRSDASDGVEVLTPDEPTLAAMAGLYDGASSQRPMATVRSEKTWRTAVRYRLEPRQALILGVYEGASLVAYLVARAPWGKWSFTEAAGDAARFPTLFAAMAAKLQEKGIGRALCLCPPDSAATETFKTIVTEYHVAESRSEMVRPIADRISWPDLLALYGDPKGRHCDLDAF